MRWNVVLIFLFMLCQTAWGESALDVEWRGEDLGEVIMALSERLNEPVLVGSKVEGSVYLKLRRVTLRQALNQVLTIHELVKWKEDGVMRVEPISVWKDHLHKTQLMHETEFQNAKRYQKKWALHYADAKSIAKLIQGEGASSLLSANGQWRIDERMNAVWVYDVSEKIKLIDQLIQASDVPLKQVMVTVRLASVDQGAERELGIKWFDQKHSEEEEFSKKEASSQAFVKPSLGHILVDGRLLDFKLSLLEKNGLLELISSPQLFTLNHQTASIETGEEVPYQEFSEKGGTTVTFKKAVLSLKVTPQILPNGRVLLKLLINQDKPSSRIVLGVPSIQTRQIETSVMLKDNQTIVLGGIYENEHGEHLEGIPLLHRIPVLKNIFGQTVVRQQKRQLLIFVTPTIAGEP